MSEEQRGWLQRLKSGLARSSTRLSEGIGAIVSRRRLDDETLQQLEELLNSAAESGRPGTRIPDQQVASDGAISIPYAGRIEKAYRLAMDDMRSQLMSEEDRTSVRTTR